MSGRENTASDTDDIWEIAAKAALDRSKKNDSPGNRNDSDESEVLMDMEPLLNVIRKYYIYKNFWFKVTSFVCWIFVVAFFYAFVYANQDAQDGFYITHSFEKAFSGDPLVIEFEDIANIEDTFIYMNNIFEGGFQEMDDGKLAVGDANIITELVFFQNRVKAIDCDSVYVVEQAYSNPANGTVSCIPVYSESVAETKPFGPNNEWTYQKFNKFHEAHFTYSYSSNG